MDDAADARADGELDKADRREGTAILSHLTAQVKSSASDRVLGCRRSKVMATKYSTGTEK